MKKYIVMIMITCMLLCSTSQAAIYVPDFSTTYIPPSVESMMDIIYNTYGVTAPSISNATDKLNAYLTLYRGVLGATYDKFYEDLQKAFNGAKTSGKITIPQSLSIQLQKGMNQALSEGLPYGVSYPLQTNPAQWPERLRAQYGITISADVCTTMYNDYKRGSRGYEPLLLFCVGANHSEIGFCLVNSTFYPTAKFAKWTNNQYYPMYNNDFASYDTLTYKYHFDYNNKTVGSLINGYAGIYNVASITMQGSMGASSTKAELQAQSGVSEKLSTQALEVITADTVIDNGVIDDTRPIVITMPNITIYPSVTVDGIDDVQDDIGAKPYIDGDVAQAVSDLQNQHNQNYGDIYAYAVDLTEYFPFCIPFDIAHALTLFVAEPQAPSFDFSFPIGYDLQEGILWDDYTIDLSMFDDVAAWARKFELLAFIVGLAAVTRQMYLRG